MRILLAGMIVAFCVLVFLYFLAVEAGSQTQTCKKMCGTFVGYKWCETKCR